MSTIRDSLGITDGEDLLDLEGSVQTVFGVDCSNASSQLETVGDLFDHIEAELATKPRGETCPTLMAFNRIRAVLSPHVNKTIRPSMPLSDIGWPAKRFTSLIEREAKLEAPPLFSGPLGMLGYFLLLGSIVLVIAALTTSETDLVYAPIPFALGMAFIYLEPCAFREDCKTVGDLVRATASRNVARLAAEGGALRTEDVWNALIDIVSESASPGEGRIDRQTRFC
jgi:hypothetical protein